MRPQVLIADALASLRELEVHDPETRSAVLRLLGMELAPGEDLPPDPDADAPVTPGPQGGRGVRNGGSTAPAARGAAAEALRVPATLTLTRRGPGVPSRSGDDARRLPGPEDVRPAPPHEPLLRPRWTRGILGACVSTRAPDGPLDVRQAADRLARGEVLDELPRLPVRTTRHGVQVLFDLGPAMVPFAADQAALLTELERILGRHKLEILYFAGTPGGGAGPGHELTWTRYEPPARETPVLLVTDLGIGHAPDGPPAPAVEWLRVLRDIAAAGSPAVALVPYPRERVAPELLRAVPVVPWDRSTTARLVRALVGPVVSVAR